MALEEEAAPEVAPVGVLKVEHLKKFAEHPVSACCSMDKTHNALTCHYFMLFAGVVLLLFTCASAMVSLGAFFCMKSTCATSWADEPCPGPKKDRTTKDVNTMLPLLNHHHPAQVRIGAPSQYAEVATPLTKLMKSDETSSFSEVHATTYSF